MTIKQSNIFGDNTVHKPNKYLTVVIGVNQVRLTQAMLDKIQKGTELVNLSEEEYTSENKVYNTFSELVKLLNSGEYSLKYVINTGCPNADTGVYTWGEVLCKLIFNAESYKVRMGDAPIFFDCVEQLQQTPTLISTGRSPDGKPTQGWDIRNVTTRGFKVVHIFVFRTTVLDTSDFYLEKALDIGLDHFVEDKTRNLSLLVGVYGEQELIGDGETIPYVRPSRNTL